MQSAEKLLLKACRGERVERPPIWFMRQAGRYLPEYQAVRKEVPFLDLCKTPDLACEVTLQPLRRFGMDAAILFSDILIAPEAMGLDLMFTEKGPVLPNPIASQSDIDRLIIPDPIESMGFVAEAIQQIKSNLNTNMPHVALVGFCGAPWTLASYMIEGGGSKHYGKLKAFIAENPKGFHQLLDKAAKTVIGSLTMQIEAGAEAVQLFDSWAGITSASVYREFILPYHQQVFAALKPLGVPMILYVNQSRGLLPMMVESGADVIGLDWMTTLSEAKDLLGPETIFQGNLDPMALYFSPEALDAEVDAILAATQGQRHIFNLGHGILPTTPIDNAARVFDRVKAYRSRLFQAQPALAGGAVS